MKVPYIPPAHQRVGGTSPSSVLLCTLCAFAYTLQYTVYLITHYVLRMIITDEEQQWKCLRPVHTLPQAACGRVHHTSTQHTSEIAWKFQCASGNAGKFKYAKLSAACGKVWTGLNEQIGYLISDHSGKRCLPK